MRNGAVLLLLLAWAGCKDKDAADTGGQDTDTEGDADTDSDSDSDTDADSDTDSDTDPNAAYSHTIVVDGDVGDFVLGEFFTSTTNGASSYVTWDADNLYVGLFNHDVVGDASHAALIYLSNGDDSVGTREGVAFNTQQPLLPFPATNLAEWRADDSNGVWWDYLNGEWLGTPNSLSTNGQYAEDESHTAVEFSFPLKTFKADLTNKVRIHISWIDDKTLYEKTTAGTPQGSFFDRYDPDYTQYYEFDLTGSLFPNNYPALQSLPVDDTGTGDTDTDTGNDTGIGGNQGGPWRNNGITVDGNASDFGPGETFATTAGVVGGVQSNFYITWDDANVYFAARHRDVEYGTSKNHLVVYFGSGAGGTTTGIKIAGQQPTLPFAADHAAEWRADGSLDTLWTWNGAAWTSQLSYFSSGLNGAAVVEQEALQTVEMSLPWTALGLTDELHVAAAWVDESAAAENTYAGSPTGIFPEGTFDPNYAAGFAFDLTSTRAPAFSLPVDAAGNPIGTPGYSRTAVVDAAVTEYPNEEDFVTSTVAVKAHVTWDSDNLYLAYEQPDITTGTSRQALVAYIGNGGAGTLTGLPFGVQQPTLPFQASHIVRWLADGSASSLFTWNGAAWVETPSYLGTAGSQVSVNAAKGIVELSVPLATLDVSTLLDLAVEWVDDRVGFTGSEAALPAAAFTDGLDPNFSAYYHFDLTSPTTPASYPTSP